MEPARRNLEFLRGGLQAVAEGIRQGDDARAGVFHEMTADPVAAAAAADDAEFHGGVGLRTENGLGFEQQKAAHAGGRLQEHTASGGLSHRKDPPLAFYVKTYIQAN